VTNRQTNAHVKTAGGDELVVQDNHTDAPIIPIGSIERLHAIRPEKVDWIFDQAQIEAETRRKEQARVNTFVFIERIGGMISALVMGLAGILGGIYLGLKGHDVLGGTIATATIGTLAVAFLIRPKK